MTQEMEAERKLHELEFPQDKSISLNPFKANSSKKTIISMKIATRSFLEL